MTAGPDRLRRSLRAEEERLNTPAGLSVSACRSLNANRKWQPRPSDRRRSLRFDTVGVILHSQSTGSATDFSEVSTDSFRIIDKASILTRSPDPPDRSVQTLQRSKTTSCSQRVFFSKIKTDGNRNQHSSEFVLQSVRIRADQYRFTD